MKKILVILILIIFVVIFLIFSQSRNSAQKQFIQCLANAGVVIYGSQTCPACMQLVEQLGGYDVIDAIYVECSSEGERCSSEMQTNYVPEIQIRGELYTDIRSLEKIGEAAGCEYH